VERASQRPRDFKYSVGDVTRIDDESSFKDVFSYNLVKFLAKYNITSAELGRKLEVTPALAQIWRGGGMPNNKNMKELCELFEVGYADFFKE